MRQLALAAAVGAIVCLGASAANGAYPGQAGEIAFVRGQFSPDGTLEHADIYVMRSDGTQVQDLTAADAGDELVPAWSPNGKRIAFVRSLGYAFTPNYSVWVMNADGSGQHRLTGNLATGMTECRISNCGVTLSPSWSPDGRRIVYARWTGTAMQLWVMRADGTRKRQLRRSAWNEVDPSWSPDGRRITFFRSRQVNGSGWVWVASSRGRLQRALAWIEGPAGDTDPLLSQTAWSASGRWVAYAKQITKVAGGVTQVLADGRSERRVAPGFEPAWSPHGTTIAYASVGDSDLQFRISTVQSNGSGQRELTHSSWPADDEYPDWQPVRG